LRKTSRLLLLAALAGCGKRGDPLPPRRIVPQPVTGLAVSQRGDRLETSFVAPRAATDASRLGVLEVELWKSTQPGDFDKLATRSRQRVAPGETIVANEPLPLPGTLVRAAAQALARGRVSPRTPIVSLVTEPPPLAPEQLSLEVTHTGVLLRWVDPNPPPTPPPTPSPTPTPEAATPTATVAASATPTPTPTPTATPTPTPAPIPAPSPGAAVSPAPQAGPSPSPSVSPSPSPSPTPPPRVRGIWIYRRPEDGAYARPLQDDVVTAAEFEDRSVLPGEAWCYVARFLASKEPLIESDSSTEACTTFKDIAPPAAPIGVTVVLRSDGVDVSWSPSSEGDLAGYRVHRATAPEPPVRLAELTPEHTSFRDPSPRVGALNVYTVTAVDKAGNESLPSTPVQVRP
jgi:hypothetical protein